jgi:hypothetical protein
MNEHEATSPVETHVKILFRYYSSILEKETVETMWAAVINKGKGLYKLDNIPFYGPSVASDDIVFAEYDESELMLTYRRTVEHSGNSIITVVIMDDKTVIEEIRKVFQDKGCLSEKVNDKYFSLEIPASMDYKAVKKILEDLESKRIIGYAEPCLSNAHRLDDN